MSDNIDLDSNNLCIPEDAFEQFQAISMYQEKEYIILPEKEPVKPKVPDLGNLSHLVHNNDIVVTTENEVNSTVIDSAGGMGSSEQQTLDNSCLETNMSLEQGPNKLHTDYEPQNVSSTARKKKHVVKDNISADSINCAILGSKRNSTDLASNEQESSVIPSQTPHKRDRKPKPKSDVSMASSDASYISSTRFSSDPESSDTTMTKRKRGRPKKSVSETVTSDRDLSSEVCGSGNNRLRNLSSPNNLEIQRKRKRGRPKKISLQANLDTQVTCVVKTTDGLNVSDFHEALELAPIKTKSDVEQKPDANNKISSEFSDNDMDDISLSQLKSTAENLLSETLELCDINSECTKVNSPPNPKKLRKPKKSHRGRPKKVPMETSDQSDTVIESAATNDIIQTDKTQKENVITEDLSLNQLKETENNISGAINNTSEVTSTDNTPTVEVDNENDENDINGTPSKRSTKIPIMPDFEYNIDSVIGNESSVQGDSADNSLLVEDTSKRPVRRKIPALRYEEEKGESEEDPFVNMELSDEDDAPRRRKGNRYYSDDEYVPGKREYKDINSTDSEANELIDATKVLRKKKLRKKSNNQSPRKKGKNNNQNLDDSDDVEICLPPSVVQASDDSQQSQPSKAWGSSSEFENFLAKKIQGTSLQIKKVSATKPTENKILEIPTIDPDAKKTVERCSQTDIKMVSTGMQTNTPYDIPMKKNVPLTSQQSEKACYFLNSIVKTTSELGTLMTQKSEDFIKKKINTSHVTNTLKMDYCVRKSFLLFKLAKHNLMQMEEDLAKHYDEFLKANNLTTCREEQKEIVAKEKPASSDSDCEIVEEEVKTSSKNSKEKHKFNPKTVFLNKELSIKIAKKPSDINKKLDIKGRHTVWINDTVMVKKVKPTQSFLAQDSRNKKPPDNKITTEMVSDFFKSYNRQRVLSVCAPFVTTDWLSVDRECVCNYFVVGPSKYNKVVNCPENGGIGINSTASNSRASETDNDCNNVKNISNKITSPDSLFVLSYQQVKKLMNDLNHVKEVCHHIQNELTDGKEEPLTLFRLSLRALSGRAVDLMERRPPSMNTTPSDDASISALPLKVLCHRKVVALLSVSSRVESRGSHELVEEKRFSTEEFNNYLPTSSSNFDQSSNSQVVIKSLLSLCVEFIQRKQEYNKEKISILLPRPLKSLTFGYVKELFYGESKDNLILPNQLTVNHHDDELNTGGLTINSINTLSEEAFLNLEDSHAYIPNNSEYLDDFDHEDHEDHLESDYNETEDQENAQPETNWVSQVQMKELRSCFSNTNSDLIECEQSMAFAQIKLEPMDDVVVNTDSPIFVKTEPSPGPDEMTIIPNIKPEVGEQVAGAIQRQNSNNYDVDAFEEFVTANKIMHGLTTEDIYSQSGLRVRRQHEPDYDEENDTSMSLLIPQTYEPLSIETVKGSLMQSSSDEDNSKNKKAAGKKKPDKRSKGKQKKTEQKPASKEPPTLTKEQTTNVEVASLTKRMRDKIRQEKKKDNSSDSESETLTLRLRSRKEQEKLKQAQSSKAKDSEIQCNNVDSTDQVDEDATTFTGFTAIDQNEISTYQKYMKYVYKNLISKPKESGSKGTENEDSVAGRPIINPNEPVELLECEPTMPIFDDIGSDKPVSKKSKEKGKTKEMLKKEEIIKKDVTETAPYIERHGWHCYPVHSEESKLYQSVYIALEKLPESFVQTYFQYQGITYKDKNDEEIDRLTNLNSLTRTAQQQLKDIKSKKHNKEAANHTPERSSVVGSRTNSPTYSDHYDELEPSDDEGAKAKDEVAAPIVQKQTENTLAKNILMDDNDSDLDDTNVKREPLDSTYELRKSSRVKSRKSDVVEDSEDLMLTADKMMNKELTLLHAPVLADDFKEVLSTGPMTRNKHKSATKSQRSTNKTNVEEDSSSEEEKQWVTTKEKLLKRLGKKEDARVDDAKRAKLVSEYIERRTDFPDSYKRSRFKPRRSSKRERFLERQKQLRVLSRELFGESPDASMSKRSQKAQASLQYKGRRNIRKVIDKKSLARSTVVANMEEFERKRRLNTRQTTLRELLGFEEGVNVLVINDEVCLEYDFEANRPVVSVHSFFTKVMKAHQYEGVKFMWDACFESLSVVEAGQPGGGCILAHCMGLGKTLQVLALLHTVLTHPRVGMKRVLVCCPLSTVLNWVDEIHKWIGPVTNQIKVFELSKLKKTYERAYQLEDWYNGGGIFIIGYELFRSLSTLDPFLDDIRPTIVNKIRTALLDPGPDIVVCDEGHLLKNDCSVLAVAMSRVVTKRRIILTGTPMQNNLREYYCMVDFVKPNLLGTYAEYSNRFENPIMNGQHRDSREEDIKLMKARTHILHKVLEGCLQRQEASVLYPYLPKKHEYTVFVNLTKCQWDLYKHYLSHYGNQNKQSILKDFHILQKIWSHPLVLHNFQTKARDERNKIKLEKLEDDLATEDQEEIKPNTTELWWLDYLEGGNMLETLDSSNKFVAVFRILDECIALDDKVLIFSTSLFCLDALEYFLKKINKWSLGQEYYRLDGSVPAEVRQKWCREFNADNNLKTKLFLVSTRAGCLGLNMTAANRVIIMDTSWNPAHDIQSIFRVYRFGQKKDCYIYRLVAMGTMEQKIYERSVTKQAVACRVVDEQQIDRHYNMADLTELYKFDEAGVTVAGGVAVGVLDVALLRVARDAALHAVHEHDSLLRGSAEQGLPEHERAAAWMQFQQEQTHKQIENKLVMEIPNSPLKRLHGQDYTQTQSGNDFKSEDKSKDYQPNEPKAKKGKKGAVIKCCIPIKEETTEDIKDEPTPRSRSKKGTKPKPSTSKEPVDTADIDELPFSVHQEEEMVEKITDILLKHNFQNKRSNTEISALVLRVRNMVKKGYVNDQDKSDDLTASIANVLLPTKQVTTPTATDIMCKSIINSAAPVQTQADSPEVIISDPTPTTSNTVAQKPTKKLTHEEKIEPELRTKRKAAIQAEKHIDTLAQDVIINLDDDDWDTRDTDFVPDEVDKPDKQNSSSKGKRKTRNASPIVSNCDSILRGQLTSHKTETSILRGQLTSQKTETSSNTTESLKSTPKNSNVDRSKELPKRTYTAKKSSAPKREKNSSQVEKATVKINTPVTQDTSILLSDDEESSISKPVEKVKETIPEKVKEKIPEKVKEKIPEKLKEKMPEKVIEKTPEVKDDEIVSLPTSLLKNQNFINIVAHTYLVGNPMLDEDAAALAAQYSTLKALKEAESTGKEVCSGPIYDIAVKVIGKVLLRKMKSVDANAAFSLATEATASIQLTEQLIASEKSCKEPATSKRPDSSASSRLREELIKVKLGMNTAQAAVKETSTVATPAPTPTPTSVVPVGLIQSAGISANDSFGQHGGECILPDDQNDIISEQRAPPAPAPSPEVVVTQYVTHAKGREPIILNPMLFNKGTLPVRVTTDPPKPRRHTYPNKTSHLRQILPKPAPPITITNDPPSVSVTGTPNAPPPVVPNTVSTSYDNSKTICLDSDDEDTAPVSQPPQNTATYVNLAPKKTTPPTPPPPVPVFLTLAHAPGDKLQLPSPLSLQSTTPANAAPVTSKQSLVLKKVVSSGAQKKYVLVPTDNLPMPTLPHLSSSSTADIPNIQVLPTTHTPQHQSKISQIAPGESLLINKQPDAGNGLRTAKCKPGDILRISQTGQIEIINCNNLLSTVTPVVDSADPAGSTKTVATPSKFLPPAHKPPPSIVDLTDVATVADKPKSPPTVKKIVMTPKKVAIHKVLRRLSSSSSESSRAPSPENPLSILKDVVQIRAVDYPATSSRSKSKKDTDAQSIVLRTEKCKSSNISVQHVISADSNSAGKSLNNAKKLIQIPKSKLPRIEAAAAEKQLQKEALLKSITPYSNKSTRVNPSRGKITEKNYSGKVKQTLNDSSKSLRITKTESVAGTSKPVTVDLTNFTETPATSLSKVKADVKKRLSSTADMTTTKKKKTEPMTLKDFNLDDIDDIIELE